MTTTTQLITADQLWDMPQHGGHCELVNGELRQMPPAGYEHGTVGFALARLLGNHVHDHKLGTVSAAETGFVVKENPDTVLAPDIAFVAVGRVPATGDPRKFLRTVPDLVVEVASPNDTLNEIEEKIDDWLAAGTRLVWLVSPKRKTVTIYRTGQTLNCSRASRDPERRRCGPRLCRHRYRYLWVTEVTCPQITDLIHPPADTPPAQSACVPAPWPHPCIPGSVAAPGWPCLPSGRRR